MEFKQYITESEKQYHLRLKTIIPLDDKTMDRIEMGVARYQPLSVSRPVKTILQRVPLDFPDVTAAEVYIVDMTFAQPAAPHVLRADIRKLLDAPEASVFVRNRNEPGEIETERLNAWADIEAEAERRGLRPASLLQDPDYSEGIHQSGLYGSDYNAALLGYLATVETEHRETMDRKANTPFRWLPVRQDTANYNENIKDAPFVSLKSKADINQHWNFDPSRGEVRRTYLDDKGNKVVLTRQLGER